MSGMSSFVLKIVPVPECTWIKMVNNSRPGTTLIIPDNTPSLINEVWNHGIVFLVPTTILQGRADPGIVTSLVLLPNRPAPRSPDQQIRLWDCIAAYHHRIKVLSTNLV